MTEPVPTEPLDLAAIEARQERAQTWLREGMPAGPNDPSHGQRAAWLVAARDVPALVAEVSRLTSALSTAEQERDEARAKIDKAAELVAGLVRADNNRMGLGPDGRITGADTLPLQLLLGLSLTLREGLGTPGSRLRELFAEIAYRKATEADLRAELERTREVVEAAKAWKDFDGSKTWHETCRALVAAVDALRTDKEPQP